MTAAHHLIKEMHAKNFCVYCGKELRGKNWKSVFEAELHYKTLKCHECKKKNRIKVNFHGSGHDNWDGNGFEIRAKESLEKKIKHKKGTKTKKLERV